MLIAMGLSTQSCSNDFLDVDSTEQITVDDLSQFNNDEGAKKFVTAIYAKFLDWNMSTFSWIGVTSITTDNADKGSVPGDTGGDKNLLDALDFTPTTSSFKEVWDAQYQGINRANQALKYLPLLDKADPNLRKRLAGEAKFMRAFIYFNLVRMYGGVPIIDHVPVEGNEADRTMTLTRKSKAEVYAFIEKDLKDAIAVLPDKSVYGNDRGRASLGAAHALLAKVYLYEKKWQDVVDQCDLVTGYSLNPSFSDIYRNPAENGPEVIFQIEGKGGPDQPGIQQYSQVQAPRGSGGIGGWGFNTPSQNLVDAYIAEGDSIRLHTTVIFEGQTLYDGTVIGNTDNPYYNYKAYSSQYSADARSNVNIRYLRYAGVLLMKAEALNELGRTSDAIPLVNQVRNRVNLPDLTVTNQNDVRKAIWKERRLELAFEHDRWFDLIRTGQAKTAMAADGKNFVVGKDELFPIPQKFIDESHGLSQQNPGY